MLVVAEVAVAVVVIAGAVVAVVAAIAEEVGAAVKSQKLTENSVIQYWKVI